MIAQNDSDRSFNRVINTEEKFFLLWLRQTHSPYSSNNVSFFLRQIELFCISIESVSEENVTIWKDLVRKI